MKRKGFTLIEVLVVFVIITLVTGIALISYDSIFKEGDKKYYRALETDITMAGSDYFQDNRDKLPVAKNYSEVNISELLEKKYIEPVVDSKGKDTCSGKVFIYKDNSGYKYETCLVCDNYGSTGRYCDNSAIARTIIITAETKDTRQSYNPNVSYVNAAATNNENVIVKFNMNNVEVSKYRIVNVNTGSKYDCVTNSSNYCEKEIDTSGTYYVTAYNQDNSVIVNNQQMSVKIYRSGIDFTISGVVSDYNLNNTACNSNKKVTVNFSINKSNAMEYYKKIEYRVMRIKQDGTKEIALSKVITSLSDSFEIGSGHYQLEVIVTNEADQELKKTSTEFDVSYKVNLSYGDVTNEKFRVVKDYSYNLPTKVSAYGSNNLDVKWYKESTRIYPETLVTEDCIHNVTGEVAIVVNVPSKLTDYCKTGLVYNESNQTLTNNPPTNVTFTNNEQTNAGTYTVKAHIDSPKYIWSDGTFADKEFTCSIGKVQATLTCKNRTYNGNSQNMYSATSGCTSITNGSKTNVGSWTLTCNVDDNHIAPSTCSATMSTQKCNPPTNVSISTAGKVTWTGSTNCNSGQYKISVDALTWSNASSGVDFKSSIIAGTGTRTVSVKVIAPDSNYEDSDIAEASTTVYSVTLNNKNCTSLLGDGNFIKNSETTISASVPSGNWWKKWTVGTGSTVFSTDKSVTFTVNGNKTYKANCLTGCTTSSGNCGDWYWSGYYTNDPKTYAPLGHAIGQCIDDCEAICTNKYGDEHNVKYWSCTSAYNVTPTRAYQTKDYCYCSW